jgi:hypothetical protein
MGPYNPKHEALLREVEMRASEWVRTAYDEAVICVSAHRAQVQELALMVLANDEVNETDIIHHLNSVTVQIATP